MLKVSTEENDLLVEKTKEIERLHMMLNSMQKNLLPRATSPSTNQDLEDGEAILPNEETGQLDTSTFKTFQLQKELEEE